MQVKEILRVKGNRLISIEPAGRAADAVRTMSKENLGSLVVLEQGRMVGLLTFRELLQALAQRSPDHGDLDIIAEVLPKAKKRGMPSPDTADAIALTFCDGPEGMVRSKRFNQDLKDRYAQLYQ